MKIVQDGYPMVAGPSSACAVAGAAVWNWFPAAQGVAWGLFGLGVAGCLSMLCFFRDSERVPAFLSPASPEGNP